MTFVEQAIGRRAVPPHGESPARVESIEDPTKAMEGDPASRPRFNELDVATRYACACRQRGLREMCTASQEPEKLSDPLVLGRR